MQACLRLVQSQVRANEWTLQPKMMLLGEASSKCEHIAGVPLQPDVARDLHQLYLAKGA
jgi:hypothetical protein